MKKSDTLFYTAMCALILTAPVISHAGDKATTDNTVIVSEQDWIVISAEPTGDMRDAESAYLRHDYDRAAAYIHKTAAWVRAEMARATGATKTMLSASANELDVLAKDVENGTVNSSKRLRDTFSRTSARLARFYGDLAAKAHSAGDDVRSGSYLQAATQNIAHAAAWAGNELKQSKAFTLAQAHTAADKLKQGADWAAAEGGKAMDWVRGEVQRIGNEIESNDGK